MAKQLQISIPQPCHEDWEQMTPDQKGRYCTVCSKTVIDFSLMTDGQILDIIQNTKGKMCGHFSDDQLNRPLIEPLQPKWYMVGMWKYLISGFLLFKGGEAKAQVKPGVVLCAKPVPEIIEMAGIPYQELEDSSQLQKVNNLKNVFSGFVKNESGKGIPFANLTLEGTTISFKTDENGYFKFEHTSKKLNVLVITIGAKPMKAALMHNQPKTMVVQYLKRGEIDIAEINDAHSFAKNFVEYKKIVFNVKDNEGNNIQNATINIDMNGQKSSLIADQNGKFKLKHITAQAKVKLTVSSVGYKTKEIEIFSNQLISNKEKLAIILDKKYNLHDDAVVFGTLNTVRKGDFSIVNVTKEHQEKKENYEKKDSILSTQTNQLTIYPNPAKVGENINIKYQSASEQTIMFQIKTLEGKNIGMYKKQYLKGHNSFQIQIPAIAAQLIIVQLMNSKGQWIASEKILLQ